MFLITLCALVLQLPFTYRRYPLMASASDDGSIHVFHSMVYRYVAQRNATPDLVWSELV
jgi:hypothetical protein